MKKEATKITSNSPLSANNMSSHKVSAKKQTEDENEFPEEEDSFMSIDDEEGYVEPKGPKKEDIKKNIIFIDDDEDDEVDDF